MKKIYFLFLVLCCFNGLSAQVANMPNVVFKEMLVSATPENMIAKKLVR